MFQQFDDFLLRFRFHLHQDLFGAFLGQIAQQVGGRVGIHLLDNVGGPLRIQRLDDGLLNFGFDLLQRLGRRLFVQRLKHGLALVGRQIFDDVGDVGGVQLGKAFMGDLQLHPPRWIGLDHIDKIPRNAARRDSPQQRVQRSSAAPHRATGGGRRRALPRRPRARAIPDEASLHLSAAST